MHRARQHAETRTRERRHRLAHEAARLMAEGGIRDFHQAKIGRPRQIYTGHDVRDYKGMGQR